MADNFKCPQNSFCGSPFPYANNTNIRFRTSTIVKKNSAGEVIGSTITVHRLNNKNAQWFAFSVIEDGKNDKLTNDGQAILNRAGEMNINASLRSPSGVLRRTVFENSNNSLKAGGFNETQINKALGRNSAQSNTSSGSGEGSGSPTEPGTTEEPAGPPPLPEPKDIDIPKIGASIPTRNYGNIVYPEQLLVGQDVIRISVYEFEGRQLKVYGATSESFGDKSPGFDERSLIGPLGSVTLPIQPSISDNNSVSWGSDNINPLQAFGAAVSYQAQDDIAEAGSQVMKLAEKIAKTKGGQDIISGIKISLAGNAVSAQGLLSRVAGAVMNPNMELLFQGPTLRPFNFTFRLSPRSSTEAERVIQIIRFFKESSAVRLTPENFFIKAPLVYKIRYLQNGKTDHPALNRIKTCALQSCSVDYTPDGSYMTFNDKKNTMVSYNLTLQFQELDPITDKDYNDLKNNNIIGY